MTPLGSRNQVARSLKDSKIEVCTHGFLGRRLELHISVNRLGRLHGSRYNRHSESQAREMYNVEVKNSRTFFNGLMRKGYSGKGCYIYIYTSVRTHLHQNTFPCLALVSHLKIDDKGWLETVSRFYLEQMRESYTQKTKIINLIIKVPLSVSLAPISHCNPQVCIVVCVYF